MDVKPGEFGDSSSTTRTAISTLSIGVYREISPPEREVHTFEFEGMPGHEILENVDVRRVRRQDETDGHGSLPER